MAVTLQDHKGIPLEISNNTTGVANLPINAIYIQFKGQKPPAELFGGEWENISTQFAGQFFRAEGGNSAGFGQVQQEGLPNIKGRASVQGSEKSIIGPNGADGVFYCINKGTVDGGNSSTSNYTNTIEIDASKRNKDPVYGKSSHVTPYNSTIRIWKRSK